MTELYLLRHAHAGDPLAWDGPDDERPLSDKGEKQAERLGRFLAEVGFVPDTIITSPKTRAARTAEIVGGRVGVAVRVDDRLGRAPGIGDFERVLRDAGDPDRPVLVGHDPEFSELVEVLCDTARMPMRKGAMARIDVSRPLEPGGGTLRWLVSPDLLRPDR